MQNLFLDLSNRGKNGALRWIFGSFVILFFWQIIGSFCALPFLFMANFVNNPDPAAAIMGMANMQNGDAFLNYIGLNLSFIGLWLGVWIVIRFLHQRGMLTLVTPARKINWARLATGFAIWFGLMIVGQAAEFILYPERIQFTFDLTRWLFFLPFILILTPMQTSAEELLFRGYWLQGTGRLTQNIIALAIINGIIFGLPHMLNPEVLSNPESAFTMFLNYFVTGAALAFYTLRDQRLELALGAHAANNMFSALFVNYANSALPTPAIMTNPTLDANFGLVALILISIVFYFIAFRAFKSSKASA